MLVTNLSCREVPYVQQNGFVPLRKLLLLLATHFVEFSKNIQKFPVNSYLHTISQFAQRSRVEWTDKEDNQLYWAGRIDLLLNHYSHCFSNLSQKQIHQSILLLSPWILVSDLDRLSSVYQRKQKFKCEVEAIVIDVRVLNVFEWFWLVT